MSANTATARRAPEIEGQVSHTLYGLGLTVYLRTLGVLKHGGGPVVADDLAHQTHRTSCVVFEMALGDADSRQIHV